MKSSVIREAVSSVSDLCSMAPAIAAHVHAELAIASGRIFAFNASVLANVSSLYGAENIVDISNCQLPYPECLFIGVDDSTGDKRISVVAYTDEGLAGPQIFHMVLCLDMPSYPGDQPPPISHLNALSSQVVLAMDALLRSSSTQTFQEPALPAKVVKKRDARGKKRYSGEFTVITNAWSHSRKRQGVTEPVSAHWVRGHFKRRKTGIFWWNPHIAGAGEVKRREAYIVKRGLKHAA